MGIYFVFARYFLYNKAQKEAVMLDGLEDSEDSNVDEVTDDDIE